MRADQDILSGDVAAVAGKQAALLGLSPNVVAGSRAAR